MLNGLAYPRHGEKVPIFVFLSGEGCGVGALNVLKIIVCWN